MRRSRKQPPRGAVPKKVRAPRVPLSQRLPRLAWREWWQTLKQVRRHLLVLAVMLLAIWSLLSVPTWLNRFPLETVGVDGVSDQRRQSEVQRTISDLVMGKNYFNLPLPEMHERLEGLGWIETVNVRRHWPDTVKITITERQPIAVWNDKKLVGGEGIVFEGVDKFDLNSLPHIYGPEGRLEEVFAYYQHMKAELSVAGFSIHQMEMDARLTARLTLNDDIQLVVDRHQYEHKLTRFVDLYMRQLSKEPQQLESADLRYADGMAIQWSQAENKRGT